MYTYEGRWCTPCRWRWLLCTRMKGDGVHRVDGGGYCVQVWREIVYTVKMEVATVYKYGGR